MQIRALVVDNNPVLLKAVAAILSQEGCIVLTAETGLEALEIVDDFCPDIVFTDLIMPMVSGEQLCRILRNTKNHDEIFIVVLSATIIEDQERILRDVQCDLCIAKGKLRDIRLHVREALQLFIARNSIIPHKSGKSACIPDGLKPSALTSELLSEKHHFFDILSNIDEGILELNNQGKVISANDAALEILSCREEMLVGTFLPYALDWGGFNEDIEQWTKQQLIASGLAKYDISEDAPLLIAGRVVTASFIPIATVGSVFALCILRDISKQHKAVKQHKELENALKLLKKMDAMTCMAGGFSHDFNNLLTVICGNLDIITMHGDSRSGNERIKLIKQAQKAALAAVDLTRQISCFSNFGIVSRENVRIKSLVRKTVGDFFQKRTKSFIIREAGEETLVYADPDELSRAIFNVLQNAVEASAEADPGERLEIIIEENEFATSQVMSGQYVSAGKYVRIDICDNGRGIQSDQLFRIFDPYYSTKKRGAQKGMGLGLTIVYAILRKHGGYVVVSSKPEKGTIVSLFLPVLQEHNISNSAGDSSSGENRLVLLIEPDEQMRKITSIMLDYLGFSVTTAVDRKEAIRELKRFTADPGKSRPLVILALCDKDESSVETCRLIHEIDGEIKVIATSGTILDPVMENYQEYGFINTLPKPFSMDSLKHIVGVALTA